MNITRLHLIGGAPLTGKTTAAAGLSHSLGAVGLSTDNIRDWMKQVASPADCPELFGGHGLTAEQYYQKYPTPQAALDEEIRQGEAVAVGIRALLDIKPPWEIVVLEGIAITPQLAREMQQRYPTIHITAGFLVDVDVQRIKRRLAARGLWGPVDSYPAHLQAIEAGWVALYNHWYKTEAKKYGFEITYIAEND